MSESEPVSSKPPSTTGFVVASHFIGNFKLGDNINRNLETLRILYELYATLDNRSKGLLCKPIVVTIVSIIEALLHDLHVRISTHIHEGVMNIPLHIVNYIRGKKLDELEKYINSARKHHLFSESDVSIYETLHSLRKLRNRIHIQNTKNHFEPKEQLAFTPERKELAEKALEKVAKTLAKNHARSPEYHYVQDFSFPWDEHFSTQ